MELRTGGCKTFPKNLYELFSSNDYSYQKKDQYLLFSIFLFNAPRGAFAKAEKLLFSKLHLRQYICIVSLSYFHSFEVFFFEQLVNYLFFIDQLLVV